MLIGSFRIDAGIFVFFLNSRFRLLFAGNIKCRRISLEFISWVPHLSFER